MLVISRNDLESILTMGKVIDVMGRGVERGIGIHIEVSINPGDISDPQFERVMTPRLLYIGRMK